MYLATLKTAVLTVAIVLTSACSHVPGTAANDVPEILLIFPDGSMRLENRAVAVEDVVIYPDGFGGEKAAIKVRLEPLHPPFYRDSIIVRRVSETLVSDN